MALSEEIKGISVKIGANTSELSSALKNINSEVSGTSKSLSEINKLLKFDPSNTELLTQKQKALSDQVEAAKQKVDALRQAQEEAKQMLANGQIDQGAYDKLSRDVIAAEQQLGKFEGQLEETNAQLDGTAISSADAANAIAEEGQQAETASKSNLNLGTVLEAATVALAAATAAIVAMGKALGDTISETATYGDNVDKMSQKLGISAEAYQEWDAIARHSGTTMESLKTSFKTLANAADDGKEGFTRLGLSIEDVQKMSTEELFNTTIAKLQEMESGTERTAIASELLGKGATELGALLNTSAEDTEAMRQAVHDLGGVMSDEGVKESARYKDSLQDMETAFSGLKRNIGLEFLPAMSDAMDGLGKLFSGQEGGAELVTKGIEGISEAISKSLPQIMPIIVSLIGDLALVLTNALPIVIQSVNAAMPQIIEVIREIVKILVDNAPLILEAAATLLFELGKGMLESSYDLVWTAADIITNFVGYLKENLPMIIEAGSAFISELIWAIMSDFPSLVATAVDIVTTLIETIIQNLPAILKEGNDIIEALIHGIIYSLPLLIDAVPEIITAIVTTLIENLPQILTEGVDIIATLIVGLIQAIPDLILAIPEIIVAIVNTFKEYDWGEIGTNLMDGIKNGILAGWEKVKEAVSKVASKIKEKFEDIFDINSPSRWASEVIGKNLDLGLAQGLEKYKEIAINTASAVGGAVANAMTYGTAADYGSTRSSAINVTTPVYLDGKVIATVVNNRLGAIL